MGMEVVDSVSVAYVTSTIDTHIVLLNKNRQFQGILIYGERGEKVAQSVNILHLLFNSGGHEGSKPPTCHLGPQGGMDHVEGLEPFFILITQGIVDMFDPPIVGDVVAVGASMKIDHGVIAFSVINDRFQFPYKVEYGFVEIKIGVEKPFANDHHHWTIEFVDAGNVYAVGGLNNHWFVLLGFL